MSRRFLNRFSSAIQKPLGTKIMHQSHLFRCHETKTALLDRPVLGIGSLIPVVKPNYLHRANAPHFPYPVRTANAIYRELG
jgi:hypothetical protein